MGGLWEEREGVGKWVGRVENNAFFKILDSILLTGIQSVYYREGGKCYFNKNIHILFVNFDMAYS